MKDQNNTQDSMVYEGTPGVRKLRTSISPHDILTEDFPKHQWPISGGWGYTRNDAVVIELDNENDGVFFEYMFIEYRSYEEGIIFRPREDRLAGFSFENKTQYLFHGDDGRSYDRIDFTVTAFLEKDFNLLSNDWQQHNGFADDQQGRQRHLELRDSKIIRYRATCWFEITRMFGK